MMWSTPMTWRCADGGRVVDGAEPEVAPEHLARQEIRGPGGALASRTPSDSGRSRPGPSASGPTRCHPRTARPAGPGSAAPRPTTAIRRRRGGRSRGTRWATVRTVDPARGGGPMTTRRCAGRRRSRSPRRRRRRDPIAPLKMEGSPNWAGNSGKLTALKPRAALARTSAAASVHVGQPGELQGDDAVRVRVRPHLEVPVVEGPQAGEPEILVRRPRVDRTAEARDEGREAQRRPDAGAVHVEDAGVDVEAAGPHFVEAGRLHAPLRPRSTDDGVEPDVGIAASPRRPSSGSRLPARRRGAPPARGRRAGGARRGPAAQSGGRRPKSPASGSAGAQGRGAGWPGPVRALCRRFPREGDTIVSERCPARGCA